MEIKHIIEQHFSERMHQHRSFEIIFTISGKGKAFVGDYIYEFHPNDIIIIGANTYHYRIQSEKSDSYEAFHLNFEEELFQSGIFEIAEAKMLLDFIQDLKESRRYSSALSIQIHKLLKKCYASQGLGRIIIFLQILKTLQDSFEYTSLNLSKHTLFKPSKQEKQLNDIYNYVNANLSDDCSVKKVAKHFKLSSSSFCQFFKRQTNMSFSDYVNDKRIHLICETMLKTQRSLADIAIENGFQNISFFNRMFKRKKKMSPSEYRKKYLGFLSSDKSL